LIKYWAGILSGCLKRIRGNRYISQLKFITMKFFTVFVTSFLFVLCGFCQVTKIYVDAKGKYSGNSQNADSYILLKKLADSDYTVRKYDMHDTLILKGTFKDAEMTIPNGKFIYYSRNPVVYIDGYLNTDINTFVNKVGYYSEGQKTGMWFEFEVRGVKSSSYIYNKDKLNGRFRRYNIIFNNYIMEEGNYVDGKKEGLWNIFGLDTLYVPTKTMEFSNNKLVKETVHYKNLGYPKWFAEVLFKRLSFKWDTAQQNVKIQVTVNTDGTITNSKIIKSNSPKVDEIVIDFFNKSKLIPSSYDGKAIKKTYELEVRLSGNSTKLKRIDITHSIIRKKEEFVENSD
jgi:hypothetical protein